MLSRSIAGDMGWCASSSCSALGMAEVVAAGKGSMAELVAAGKGSKAELVAAKGLPCCLKL